MKHSLWLTTFLAWLHVPTCRHRLSPRFSLTTRAYLEHGKTAVKWAVAVLLLAPIPVHADEVIQLSNLSDGRISGPVVIYQPGDYLVVKDITAQGTVLDVRSDNVTIDLGWHTVKTISPQSSTIMIGEHDGVSITNGTVLGGRGTATLYSAGGAHLTLDRITIQGQDDTKPTIKTFGHNASITNCETTGSPEGIAIAIDGPDRGYHRVTNNAIVGIIMTRVPAAVIDSNVIDGKVLVLSEAPRTQVLNNTIRSNIFINASIEIRGGDSRIEGNSIDKELWLRSSGNFFANNVSIGEDPALRDDGDNRSAGNNYLPDRQ